MITLAWEIVGGAAPTAELLPVPGPVPLVSATVLPLNPAGSMLITLKATNPAGETAIQSVQIETFDPHPQDPAAAAAAAAAAESGDAASDSRALEGGDAVDQERIAPRDAPPRFD